MKWRTDLEEWADQYFLGEKGLNKRKTFGCPSYYAGSKLFAFLYEDGLGVKMDPVLVKEKIAVRPERYFPFNPGDGVMKNWLIIVLPDISEYEEERELIEGAFQVFLAERSSVRQN